MHLNQNAELGNRIIFIGLLFFISGGLFAWGAIDHALLVLIFLSLGFAGAGLAYAVYYVRSIIVERKPVFDVFLEDAEEVMHED